LRLLLCAPHDVAEAWQRIRVSGAFSMSCPIVAIAGQARARRPIRRLSSRLGDIRFATSSENPVPCGCRIAPRVIDNGLFSTAFRQMTETPPAVSIGEGLLHRACLVAIKVIP